MTLTYFGRAVQSSVHVVHLYFSTAVDWSDIRDTIFKPIKEMLLLNYIYLRNFLLFIQFKRFIKTVLNVLFMLATITKTGFGKSMVSPFLHQMRPTY